MIPYIDWNKTPNELQKSRKAKLEMWKRLAKVNIPKIFKANDCVVVDYSKNRTKNYSS